MTRGKKRGLIAAVVAACALIAAIAGYAYWTATGTGTATGTAGTTSPIALSGTFTPGIFPGGSKTVTFTADNPNPGSVRVGTIHLASVSFDAGHSGCSAADFTMADVPVNAEIATGSGQAITPTGTLVFADTASNQDACKGATITLNLTST